jgi:hypothetical protein
MVTLWGGSGYIASVKICLLYSNRSTTLLAQKWTDKFNVPIHRCSHLGRLVGALTVVGTVNTTFNAVTTALGSPELRNLRESWVCKTKEDAPEK